MQDVRLIMLITLANFHSAPRSFYRISGFNMVDYICEQDEVDFTHWYQALPELPHLLLSILLVDPFGLVFV